MLIRSRRDWGSKTYVKHMHEDFKNTFGHDPRQEHSPMVPDYKPEFDESDLCDAEEERHCWQCVGELQRATTLGRVDVMCVFYLKFNSCRWGKADVVEANRRRKKADKESRAAKKSGGECRVRVRAHPGSP